MARAASLSGAAFPQSSETFTFACAYPINPVARLLPKQQQFLYRSSR
jgi:hypothetical protein